MLAQKRLVEELTIAAQRLDNRHRRAIELWQPRAGTRPNCDTWLKTLPPGTAVQDYVGPEPKLAKGEPDILAAIARLERRCRELGANLHRVESAAYPLSHARQRLREIIDQMAQPPNVSMLVEHERGHIAWPQVSLR